MTLKAILLFITLVSSNLAPAAARAQTPVTVGSEMDYQGSVLRPWGEAQERIVVFERLDPGTLSGDLYVATSSDSGASWSAPSPIIDTSANERHAEMVQTGESAFQLYFLSDASGSFRIHRATSADGESFTEQGAIDLGWPAGGEINPHVIRLPSGRIVLTYHRLGGAAYVSWSDDEGVSWNTDRIQISPGNAALPRITWRASDARFLLAYQTNPGDNQLRLWSRSTTDLTDWSDPPTEIVTGGNNHDAMPLVLEQGRFAVFWARVSGSAFQVVSSTSEGGQDWTSPRQRTFRSGLDDIQPHAIAIGNGCVDLYWGAEAVSGGNDRDILRDIACFDPIFRDRFQ
ncbi:MAG: hypothetical protein GVY11_05660 [Gammaproteobacteria bacterium]|jgi:hypothetical protein|nr:hypothetical protein [Gammaproteobacteria bacterium]